MGPAPAIGVEERELDFNQPVKEGGEVDPELEGGDLASSRRIQLAGKCSKSPPTLEPVAYTSPQELRT